MAIYVNRPNWKSQIVTSSCSVQTPILNRFGYVFGADGKICLDARAGRPDIGSICVFQICDRARHLEKQNGNTLLGKNRIPATLSKGDPDFHADDAVAVISQIMQAEFSGYHDNANSLFRIGGRLFTEEGSKTDFLLFVLGHEIAHNVMKTTYDFYGETLWHKMMHEVIADVYAFALLQRMGLSKSIKFIMEKFSHYTYLERVAEDDFFTIEAHEGARAQLALFQLVLENSFDQPFDWNKLGQVVSFMLRRNSIKSSDSAEDTFRQMLDYYMNPEKMTAGDETEWKKRGDIFFSVHPEHILEGGSGPMKHKILSTVEIGLKLEEYVNRKKAQHNDEAMLAENHPGGVDLASRWLDMDIHRKGEGVSLDEVMTALEADGIAGLFPVIIQFKAVEKGGSVLFSI